MGENNQLQLCSEYVLLLVKQNKAKISLKKLNIILYYAYVEYLVKNKEIMFKERFHAWSKISIHELSDEWYPTWMGDILVESIEFNDEVLEDEAKKELLAKYYKKLINMDDKELLEYVCNLDEVYKKHHSNNIRSSMWSQEGIMSAEEIYAFYSNEYNFKRLMNVPNNKPKR